MSDQAVADKSLQAEDDKAAAEKKEDLLRKILDVLEFYFSDINLSRNKFLAHKVLEDPYVPITLLMSFHKLKELTDNEDMLIEAIKLSKMLHITEDSKKVFRTTEIQPVDQIEEHVIYVENVPENKDHEWLRQIFSTYGQVFYVSLPVFRKSRQNKGFAFVEFASEKDALKAYQAFQSSNQLIPTSMPPEELLSIKTFDEPDSEVATEVDRKTLVNSVVETRELAQLGMKVMLKGDWRRLRNRFLNKLHTKNKQTKEKSDEKEVESVECNYKEGLVLKLEKAKHEGNLEEYLMGIRMRPKGGVVYVNNRKNSDFVFIRFATAEQAGNFLSQDLPHITLIEGKEEAKYWEMVAKIVAAKKNRQLEQKVERKREKRRARNKGRAGTSFEEGEDCAEEPTFESLLEQRHTSEQEKISIDLNLRSKRKKKRDRKTGQRTPANKHIFFEDDGAVEEDLNTGTDPQGVKRVADISTNGEEEPVLKKPLIESEKVSEI
ncbi:la-related protein 7-like [Neocloeon triangulifer]|uniref:la-related protein 7-like n=1 Tax=Neocloeon triangulifer TaxID=2078957 RepID=UPI00286F6BCA|nr:la-related protein 7-like [Neocloeon triangulifer]